MYTSPLLAGPYRPASCRNDAHSNSSRSYAIPRVSARRSAIRYWRTVWRSMSPSISPVAVRNASSAAASDSVRVSSSARRRVPPRTSCHVNGRRLSGPPAGPATLGSPPAPPATVGSAPGPPAIPARLGRSRDGTEAAGLRQGESRPRVRVRGLLDPPSGSGGGRRGFWRRGAARAANGSGQARRGPGDRRVLDELAAG